MRRQASPADGAGQAQLIERSGIVVVHAARQNLLLPGVRRNFETLQLAQHFQQSALAGELRLRRHVLPAQQPAHELRRRDRLNLLAQRRDREVMNARQQPPLAPLDSSQLGRGRVLAVRGVSPVKFPRRIGARGFQAQQGLLDVAGRTAQPVRQAQPHVIGPECIIQPSTMASNASSREAVFDGSSGGATSNCASGKISAKSWRARRRRGTRTLSVAADAVSAAASADQGRDFARTTRQPSSSSASERRPARDRAAASRDRASPPARRPASAARRAVRRRRARRAAPRSRTRAIAS